MGGVRDFEIFWQHMYDSNKVKMVDLRCNEKIKTDLRELGFIGKEDYVFVETAIAADRYLITEDSDYGVHCENEYQGVYDYLTMVLRLFIYSTKNFNCLGEYKME